MWSFDIFFASSCFPCFSWSRSFRVQGFRVFHIFRFFRVFRVSGSRAFRVQGPTLKWLKNFLNERKQCISYSDVGKTSMCSIICGVPQGSILEPLLFLIYANDLHKASSILKQSCLQMIQTCSYLIKISTNY